MDDGDALYPPDQGFYGALFSAPTAHQTQAALFCSGVTLPSVIGGPGGCLGFTIGAAIAAGLPWLTFYCPTCRVAGSVDLHTLDRHPAAAISSLIPSLSCRRCSPHAPFARLEMLTSEQP
jgi:hypothetical protein